MATAVASARRPLRPAAAGTVFGFTRVALTRLTGAIIVIFGVVSITFLLTRVVSPDPTGLFVSPTADAAERENVRQALGLSDPIPVQFVTFIGNLLTGDLGTSFMTGQPVAQDLLSRLPATAELALYALLFGTSLGVIAGVIAAVKENSWFDHLVRTVTVAGLALPQFWLGLMLLWIFFVVLGIAPGPTGRLPVGVLPPPHVTGLFVIDGLLSGQWALVSTAIAQLVLPVLTLGYGVFAPIARGARSAMIGALNADYMRTAHSLGIARGRAWFVYALKNALLPVVTMLAGVVGWAFSGAVLVEGVFGWPGIGQYALNAMQSSDFPAVQGFVLFAAILYVVIYQLLDLAYSAIDPRIRP